MNKYNGGIRYTPTKQDILEQDKKLIKLKNKLNDSRLTYLEKQTIEYEIESIEWWLNIWS